MERLRKTILVLLLAVSAASWYASQVFQADMMNAMAGRDAISIPLFVAIWTVGMAAMMFPAVSPMVLLYNRLASGGGSQAEISMQHSMFGISSKTVLFAGCYLSIWSLAGLALLFGWSFAAGVLEPQLGQYLYGAILVIAGIYQFSPVKAKCLGYCESPMSFFARRWSAGTAGALRMGAYHGLYCLGCCWPYFLLMLALGWMDLSWMALFALIIFGEKIWNRGIWIAKAAGIGFATLGILFAVGLVPAGVLPTNTEGHMALTDQDMQDPSMTEMG
jgi:predicted metal-binding membrane protein